MSEDLIRRAVAVIMGTVVGLTFLFGFGNVLSLGLRLGVPGWIAPLVAPAVDLSVLGLLLGLRQLTAAGACDSQLKPLRRLLMFCSVATLVLNVAEPLIGGEYGKAAFDAVGPLLLIGWADVGPCLLQGIRPVLPARQEVGDPLATLGPNQAAVQSNAGAIAATNSEPVHDELLERARREDVRHRELHHRPISAETLRQRLHVGSSRSRSLVRAIRSASRTSGDSVRALTA
ncbi:hypothetical protein C8D87_11573 [Lentzea atacamensis]|uniref:DUF2637 domain-containing protein n=1 Tax=Lentzea atacamensis TaxID=531938 RepID=A0ABX9DVK8_9PSEU|nr:hypothetical protein [Lentzea atacamensis]RAS59213.1 hypothetical protein C8D87_11573 [Lentzea atacamensis]